MEAVGPLADGDFVADAVESYGIAGDKIIVRQTHRCIPPQSDLATNEI
jgi:hypothetical protein